MRSTVRRSFTDSTTIYVMDEAESTAFHSMFFQFFIPLQGTIVEFLARLESSHSAVGLVDTGRLVAGFTRRCLASFSDVSHIMSQISHLRFAISAVMVSDSSAAQSGPALSACEVRTFLENIPTRNRRRHLRKYPDSFVGSEAIQFMQAHIPSVTSLSGAVAFGTALLRGGFILPSSAVSSSSMCGHKERDDVVFDPGFELYSVCKKAGEALEALEAASACSSCVSAHVAMYSEDPTLKEICSWSSASSHLPTELVSVTHASEQVWSVLASRLGVEIDQLQAWEKYVGDLGAAAPSEAVRDSFLLLQAPLVALRILYREVVDGISAPGPGREKVETTASGIVARTVKGSTRVFDAETAAPVLALMEKYQSGSGSDPARGPLVVAEGKEEETYVPAFSPKVAPRVPGLEYAMVVLQFLVISGGSGPVELLVFDQGQTSRCARLDPSSLVQITISERHLVALDGALATSPSVLSTVSREMYSNLFFMHLLLEPSVLSPAMLAVDPEGGGGLAVVDHSGWLGNAPRVRARKSKHQTHGLSGVDAVFDKVMVDTSGKESTDPTEPFMLSVLLASDNLGDVVDAAALDQFIKRRPEQVLSAWIEGMVRQNIAYRDVFSLSQMRELYGKGSGILVPFVISESVISTLYERYVWLQNTLRHAGGPVTHADILTMRYPVLGRMYTSLAVDGPGKEMSVSERFACLTSQYEAFLSGRVLDDAQRALLPHVERGSHGMYVGTVGRSVESFDAYADENMTPEAGLSVLDAAHEAEEAVAAAAVALVEHGSGAVFGELDKNLKERVFRRIQWESVEDPGPIIREALAHGGGDMEVVSLNKARGVTDGLVREIVAGVPGLRCLDLADASGIDCIGEAVRNARVLEQLILRHVDTVRSLTGLEGLSALRMVDIRSCLALTTIALPTFDIDVLACPNTYGSLQNVLVGGHAWPIDLFSTAVALRLRETDSVVLSECGSIYKEALSVLAREVDAIGGVSRIVVRQSRVCSQGGEALCAMIASSPNLTELDMSQLDMGRKCTSRICDALAAIPDRGHASMLRSVKMANNSMTSRGASRLGQALAGRARKAKDSGESELELDVAHTGIGATGINVLLEPVLGSTTPIRVSVLDLSRNRLGNSGAVAVGKALTEWGLGATLEVLKMNGCGIHGKGLVALGGALQGNDRLKQLELGKNRIHGADGVQALMSVFRSGLSSLQVLVLAGNKLGDGGGVVVAQGARWASHLVVLDVRKCKIGVVGAAALDHLVQEKIASGNVRLRKVMLSHNVFQVRELDSRGLFAGLRNKSTGTGGVVVEFGGGEIRIMGRDQGEGEGDGDEWRSSDDPYVELRGLEESGDGFTTTGTEEWSGMDTDTDTESESEW